MLSLVAKTDEWAGLQYMHTDRVQPDYDSKMEGRAVGSRDTHFATFLAKTPRGLVSRRCYRHVSAHDLTSIQLLSQVTQPSYSAELLSPVT